MIQRMPGKHVVLFGIGHTNAHVLRMWGMQPVDGTDLTCISNYPVATYSGMLPAVLAGQVAIEQMQIDLVKLCGSVGARLVCDPVMGIDHELGEIHFRTRPPIPYDALSIGIGSVPTMAGLETGAERVIPIKPMQTFLDRLGADIKRVVGGLNPDAVIRLVVVGGGVAGTEITFCLPPFLQSLTDRDHSIHLITNSETVLPEVIHATRAKVIRRMQGRGVRITTGRRVTHFQAEGVTLDDDSVVAADVVIWATGAVAPPILSDLGLPLDERGFIATDHTLRSTSGRPVFAVGDTGTIVNQPLPKAGVYAVRQGPVLWENLRRELAGQPLQRYDPQRSFLKLINLGDGTAIGQWKRLALSGHWVMRLKDRIDQRFMDMYRPQSMISGEEKSEMQCRGCGCKLGGDLLESALDPVLQTVPLEDAAVINDSSEYSMVASTDFFSSPFDDAYLAGRIAALHSASDILACGAQPTQALANVVVPEGDRQAQQRLLKDFLAGAQSEFDAMDASIVGGHTIVGPRFEVGFTVIGKATSRSLIRKKNLQQGDLLFLTKPLGIGVLLAAHARGACAAEHYVNLIDVMLMRQQQTAQLAVELGVTAGTDVTGFGLAGHLLEMLQSSRLSAQLDGDTIPLLSGVEEYLQQGIESSLAPENRQVQTRIGGSSAIDPIRLAVLFDPQTCGGLLLGVAAAKSQAMQTRFAEAQLPAPTCIGEVTDDGQQEFPLMMR